MIYLWTVFDKRHSPPDPLASMVYSGAKLHYFNLYMPGTKEKLVDIVERKKYIASLFNEEIVVNDFKSHIQAFDLSLGKDYRAYEIPDYATEFPKAPDELKKFMASKIAQVKKTEIMPWQQLMAHAIIVYLTLEYRGVHHGSLEAHPQYELSTFSGRSKSLGFSIQSQGDGEDLVHTDFKLNNFICADWIAADMRVLAHLSGDPDMNESYQTSDPYTLLATKMGVNRQDAKSSLIKSIYSLDTDSRAVQTFPKFREWMIATLEQIKRDGYSTSILGRRFYLKDASLETVFNAVFQGSVAHAMHNVMVQLQERLPANILTELHDSVVLCTSKDAVRTTIETVKDVMLHPLRNMVENDPIFPLSVSIGGRWRAWRPYREYRV